MNKRWESTVRSGKSVKILQALTCRATREKAVHTRRCNRDFAFVFHGRMYKTVSAFANHRHMFRMQAARMLDNDPDCYCLDIPVEDTDKLEWLEGKPL